METRETIGDVYNNYGYVMDPHSAVAYKALEKYRLMTTDPTYSICGFCSPAPSNSMMWSLQSADTDKYEQADLNPFEAMKTLAELTKLTIPSSMSEQPYLQVRQSQVIAKDQLEAEVKKTLGLE